MKEREEHSRVSGRGIRQSDFGSRFQVSEPAKENVRRCLVTVSDYGNGSAGAAELGTCGPCFQNTAAELPQDRGGQAHNTSPKPTQRPGRIFTAGKGASEEHVLETWPNSGMQPTTRGVHPCTRPYSGV